MKWTLGLVLGLAFAGRAAAAALPVPTYVPPISPVYGHDEEVAAPAPPLRFTSAFPDTLRAGAALDLAWEGGDGRGVEVYFVARWARQRDYELVPIAPNTTDTGLSWRVPPLESYPAGTNIIVGVKDGSEGPGSSWWDLSPPLALV
ncbi:hypothetical protein Q8F55_000708 [Vanrija albida]|uniref:Fibronectin type-III domain-containing protein n=1 Tax=Vanrija albida TaxID=181172 RepID=A0ABR3QE27_9TREE